jgi:putative Holliday junction resolvase
VGRILGVDLGTRRVGLAVSDPTGTLAGPHRVLERSGDPAADRRAIVAAAREVGAERIVVGLPRSLSGRDGPAARAARAEVEALRAEAGADLPVELHDERFSTVSASRALAAGPGGRTRRGRRTSVDAAAAAIILQSYLESRR